MKKQILSEEFRRMQKLAGIINENQENLSPEQIAKTISQNTDQFESDSKLSNLANKIVNDPKAVEELSKILSAAGISLNEGEVDLNPQDVNKIALAFAKKAETLTEETNYGATFWTGMVGGGIIARYIASLGDIITPHMELMGHSPSHMGAMVAGGIAGAILLSLGGMVYDKLKQK